MRGANTGRTPGARRVIPAIAGAAVVLSTLSGCSNVDLFGITQARAALDVADTASNDSDAKESADDAEKTPEPEPSVTPEPVVIAPPTPSGDLASGSASHRIPAGSGTITLDYWTNQNPVEWTADKTVPIYLNVTISDAGVDSIYSVSWFRASVAGTPVIEENGKYQITPPFSYFSTIVVPPGDATTAEVLIEFEIAMETEEDSGEFTKIRLADTLSLAFMEEKASGTETAVAVDGK